MRWLTIYMALSRMRSLEQSLSIGSMDTVKKLINDGPPSGMLSRFALLFDEKAAATDIAADKPCQSSDGDNITDDSTSELRTGATEHCAVEHCLPSLWFLMTPAKPLVFDAVISAAEGREGSGGMGVGRTEQESYITGTH